MNIWPLMNKQNLLTGYTLTCLKIEAEITENSSSSSWSNLSSSLPHFPQVNSVISSYLFSIYLCKYQARIKMNSYSLFPYIHILTHMHCSVSSFMHLKIHPEIFPYKYIKSCSILITVI